ncbi:secretion protein EspA [Arsenophonus sp. ENCA]|nr:secretion protein EspA [Arsenophonus sp. ENCA]
MIAFKPFLEFYMPVRNSCNRVDDIIAKIAKEGDKALEKLPPDVIDYMRNHGVTVDGMSIDDFLQQNDPTAALLAKLREKIAESGADGMQSASWQDVVRYMDEHGIKVDGQRCSDYIWGLPEVGSRSYQKISREHMQHIADVLAAAGGLDQGKLGSVKAALETVSNRASDFVFQSQLQLQKVMQGYNVTVSLINSMQTMLAEMNKSIAQNIR